MLLDNYCQADSSSPSLASSSSHDREAVVDVNELDTYKAIRILHKKLDVDDDGEVDDFESKKFLESDNKDTGMNNRDGAYSTAHKLRYLHQDGKDRSISVDELWEAWKNSPVHNWTTSETIYWLENYVELPECTPLFEQMSINGTLLPRLATDSQFIHKLGITDPSARQRISIKAMDVVLFGSPKFVNSSKTRDIIVSIVTVIAILACCVFYKRSIQSQKALQAVQDHLESLQRAEDQMQDLQQELDKALKAQEAVLTEKRNLEHQLQMHRQLSASSNLSEQSKSSSALNNCKNISNGDSISLDAAYVDKLEDEVKSLRKELEETLQSNEAKKFRAPLPLRSLLRATYNIESQYYNEKKAHLETKATEVKLKNQKLQKKKTSFLGYYKMAQENSLEDDINNILEVKEEIMQVTKEIKERSERWRAIEELCGCSLDLTSILQRI